MILAGDIGGTKTNLAYFESDGPRFHLVEMKSYRSQDHPSLIDILRIHRRSFPAQITKAAFGIAGPVVEGRSRLTNLGWNVDSRELASEMNIPYVGLMNDLEAMAYGVLRLDTASVHVLNPGIPEEKGTIGVIAAGTGLGQSGLLWTSSGYRAIPSEGGHRDFGPRTEAEISLLLSLKRKYDRVSYERILSGPGLVNVYDFFRSQDTTPEPAWLVGDMSSGDPAASITRAAIEKSEPLSQKALELFVDIYGAEAGNLALTLVATGGVYIGGGIAPKILSHITKGTFLKSFVEKGRYKDLMQRIPVFVIMNNTAPLLGAAHYAVEVQ